MNPYQLDYSGQLRWLQVATSRIEAQQRYEREKQLQIERHQQVPSHLFRFEPSIHDFRRSRPHSRPDS